MGRSLSTRPGACRARWIAAATLAAVAATAQAEGLVLHALEVGNGLREPVDYTLHAHVLPTGIHSMGDYYFFDPSHGLQAPGVGSWLSGLRASTGIAGLQAPTSTLEPQLETPQNLPYLGLGYSRLWFNSQLSLNADFGLASQNAGALGRVRSLLQGTQSLDDLTRELRWQPVMAVNVSYSF